MKYRLKHKTEIKPKQQILISKKEVLEMYNYIKRVRKSNGFIFGLEKIKKEWTLK